MTTRNRRTLPSAQSRFVLRNKLSNDIVLPPVAHSRMSKLSEMSPEARRAMFLTQEEAKENMSSSPETLKANLYTGTRLTGNTNREDTSSKTGLTATKPTTTPFPRSPSKGRVPARPLRADTTLTSQRSSMPQATARSRSTLSHHDMAPSVSERSACNTTDVQNNNAAATSRKTNVTNTRANNNSSLSNMDDNNDGDDGNNYNNSAFRSRADGMDDDLDAMELNGNDDVTAHSLGQESDGGGDGEGDGDRSSQSFVLTLDRALENRGVSRLRGDITDSAAISEPGTVRALNGGRLTNAQEVVVNVCHEDERELVFHDDDQESLDTAKTVSNIRINVWLEYNNNFRPDSLADMEDELTSEASEDSSSHYTLTKPVLNAPPGGSLTGKTRNVKTGNKNFLHPQKETLLSSRLPASRVTSVCAGSQGSSHSNNNNNNLARPKSGSPAGRQDVTSVRLGSGLSTESSRRSSTSASSKQRELLLRRKAKT